MLSIQNLNFHYPEGPSLFSNFSVTIPEGARVLLIGANGTGKSTLLRLIAGQHLIPNTAIRWKNRSTFHDLELAGDLALVEGELPLTLDIPVQDLLKTKGESTREENLLRILEISPQWRMHQLSSGQRKKVQILLSLRTSASLLLLDEVTAHLDLIARRDLLKWIQSESENQRATVIYATHIFDGLARKQMWPTHLLFLSPKKGLTEHLFYFSPIDQISGLGDQSLLEWCETWMS